VRVVRTMVAGRRAVGKPQAARVCGFARRPRIGVDQAVSRW